MARSFLLAVVALALLAGCCNAFPTNWINKGILGKPYGVGPEAAICLNHPEKTYKGKALLEHKLAPIKSSKITFAVTDAKGVPKAGGLCKGGVNYIKVSLPFPALALFTSSVGVISPVAGSSKDAFCPNRIALGGKVKSGMKQSFVVPITLPCAAKGPVNFKVTTAAWGKLQWLRGTGSALVGAAVCPGKKC